MCILVTGVMDVQLMAHAVNPIVDVPLGVARETLTSMAINQKKTTVGDNFYEGQFLWAKQKLIHFLI